MLWIQQLTKTLYKFIWGNNIEKISRKTLALDFENGGLRNFIKSLKLTWFRRLFTTNSSWINIFPEVTGCSITKLTQFGPSYCKQRANFTHNSFWKEAIEALSYFAEFLESFEMKDSSFNFQCNTLFYWLTNWGDFVSPLKKNVASNIPTTDLSYDIVRK